MRILHEGSAHSQREIVDALQAAGHDVTQATVSRDLREIGAAKVRISDGFVYRLPDEVPRSLNGDLVARSLRRTLEDFAIEVRAAGSLVVIDTAPGHASAVARALDLAGIDDIVGTVAGDDTIFVATPGIAEAARLADTWRHQRPRRTT
jgi:transcriptional regulator of arginine metabolism